MKTKTTWLSLLVLCGLAVWLAFFLTKHWNEISQISLDRPGLLILIFVLLFLSTFTFSVELKLFLGPLDVRLGQLESFALTLATNFHNLISPRGGMVVRGLYLKKRRQCSYTKYLVIMSGRFLINFVVAGACGILACVLLYAGGHEVGQVLPFFFVFIMLAAILPMVVPLPVHKGSEGFLIKQLTTAAHAWHAIRSSHITVRNIVLTNLIRLFLQTIIWNLSFRTLGQSIEFSQALILAVVNDLSLVIAFTPGGLGIQDVMVILSSQGIHLPATYALAAVVTRRILYTIMLLIFGLPSTHFMLVRNEIRLSDEDVNRN